MIIRVKVTPNAKKSGLIEDRDSLHRGIFYARISALPQDGKANKALIEMIANHYNVKKSAVKIIRGLKAREKTVEIT